jgi:hypothetical protein
MDEAHEMSVFAETVYYYHDDILPFRFRKPLDEIHVDVSEWSMGNG